VKIITFIRNSKKSWGFLQWNEGIFAMKGFTTTYEFSNNYVKIVLIVTPANIPITN